MKKYKKYSGKLLQIRLSEKEHKEVNDFIKKFNVTKRDFMLAVIKELEGFNIIRDNYFWQSDKTYAWANINERVKILDDSVCELCGQKNNYRYGDDYSTQLVRHHHDGYEGENAFKVHIVCRKCHGFVHQRITVDFEKIKEEFNS